MSAGEMHGKAALLDVGRKAFADPGQPREVFPKLPEWRLARVREFIRVLEPNLGWYSGEMETHDGRIAVGLEESFLFFDKIDAALDAAITLTEGLA